MTIDKKLLKILSQILVPNEMELKTYIEKITEAVSDDTDKISRCEEELIKNGCPKDEVDDYLDEQKYRNRVFAEVTRNLLVVLIYSEIEKELKQILALSIQKKDMLKAHKLEDLEKLFKEHLEINLAEITDFSKVDEIRLVNNCVKHDGRVSKRLANINSYWKEKKREEIKVTSEKLEKFIEGKENFFKDLIQKL